MLTHFNFKQHPPAIPIYLFVDVSNLNTHERELKLEQCDRLVLTNRGNEIHRYGTARDNSPRVTGSNRTDCEKSQDVSSQTEQNSAAAVFSNLVSENYASHALERTFRNRKINTLEGRGEKYLGDPRGFSGYRIL